MIECCQYCEDEVEECMCEFCDECSEIIEDCQCEFCDECGTLLDGTECECNEIPYCDDCEFEAGYCDCD